MKRLIGLGVLVVIAVIVGIVFFNLPQRIGLAETPTEKLLSATPDRETAAAMKAELASAGLNTQGMDIYVFPYKENDENVVIAVLDSSQGFDIRNLTGEDAITEYLGLLANLDKGGKYDIQRVAVDYKNDEGDSILVLTAPSATITRYTSGSISRQQFLQELEGQVNFVEVARTLTEELR